MTQTTIGSYQVLGKLGASKRFQAFSASQRGADSARRGTLYVMTDELAEPDLFIETVDAIRAAWPFAGEADRDVVLPEPRIYKGRPWFFVPESMPLAAAARGFGRAAFASLREQLRWLEEFEAPGGERRFAHGDLRKRRMALLDAEHPLLIAPGWVAASDYARGRGLAHVRGDDAWHFGKLWLQESDRSFAPDGVTAESNAAPARVPAVGQTPRVAVPPPPPEARQLERDQPTAPPPPMLEEPSDAAPTAPPPPLAPARPLPPQVNEPRAFARPGGASGGPPPLAAKPAGAAPPPWPAPASEPPTAPAREPAVAPVRAARPPAFSQPPAPAPTRGAPPPFVSSHPPAAAASFAPPASASPPAPASRPAPASQPAPTSQYAPPAAPRSGAQPALIAALIVAVALLVALLVAVWL